MGLIEARAARAPEVTGPRSGKWAHETPKSLAPDPKVTWGRLDNGFRYALRPHAGVPGRVALQLIVLAGSLEGRPWSHATTGAQPLQFKQYARLEGTIDHPAEVVLKSVQARVMDAQGAVRAAQTVKL